MTYLGDETCFSFRGESGEGKMVIEYYKNNDMLPQFCIYV